MLRWDTTAWYNTRAGGRNIFDRDFPFMLSSSRRPYDSKRVKVRKRVLFLEAKYTLGN